MSIINILNQIGNSEVVLPAIQRDFVWSEERTERLLDSIMRGYPIGIILLWETYEDIQYRGFLRDFRPGAVYTYQDNPKHRRLRLVLDGQQRLQSLYIALYGTREGKDLYFDLLSGRHSDDVAEDKFQFRFMDSRAAKQFAGNGVEDGENGPQAACYRRLSHLFTLGARAKLDLVEGLASELALTADDKVRLNLNLHTLDDVLSKEANILKVSTIDEDLPPESPSRKSEADVLEIFVRINREGTPLSRSDLIFSMLKLNWKESAEALPEFVRAINSGNAFELDTDFVIRCLFAVSDLGTKLDLNLLRKRTNVQKLRANFGGCCAAIKATVDFVQTECWCQSSSVLGGSNTLIPLVYYLFYANKHEIPNDQIANARKALYMIGFARPFSRWGESRLGAFIRAELLPLRQRGEQTFPFDRAVSWVKRWEPIDRWEELLQANHLLTLHLVQGLTGAKVQYERNAPQIDHIFPRSKLREKGLDESQINHFANFWILAKGKNQNKSNRHPADYFKDVGEGTLRRAMISRELLDYRRYTTFLRERRERMIERVRKSLELAGDDILRGED
jgi:hypothetical protein